VISDVIGRDSFAARHDSAVAEGTTEEDDTLIEDYGEVLQQFEMLRAVVLDSDLLPGPKARLKETLARALSLKPPLPMREHLKAGYLHLAHFQTGVGLSARSPDFEHLGEWLAVVNAEREVLEGELRAAGLW
jgi:hypothetical protein